MPSSSTAVADESTNNPYFLLATKSPGIVLTLQPLTGPENYLSWARSVFLALSSRTNLVLWMVQFHNQILSFHCTILGVGVIPLCSHGWPTLSAWISRQVWCTSTLQGIYGLTSETDFHREILQGNLSCRRKLLVFLKVHSQWVHTSLGLRLFGMSS